MNKLKKSPSHYYNLARNTLLGVILFTALNCVLYLLQSDSYYVVSIRLAYMLFEPEALGIVLPALILAAYVAAYILSKKKGLWLIVGLVLFALDTLVVAFLLISLLDYPEAIFNLGVDLLAHIVILVLLFLGVKNRKAALLSDEEKMQADTAAGRAAAAIEGRESVQAELPEVEGSVSVSSNGKPNGMLGAGVVRFEAEEAVVGAQGGFARAMVGALASMKEIARFGYGSVKELSFTNKRRTAMRIDLDDGRILCVVVPNGETADRFLRLLRTHGANVPERDA
ncbi:MAG: hypothetical protein K6G17_07325 [Oscillospiraceae bacterium]|nr:hypothetical protein [Oscillospiraceae bacterium]